MFVLLQRRCLILANALDIGARTGRSQTYRVLRVRRIVPSVLLVHVATDIAGEAHIDMVGQGF